jgi:Zn-dependent protease/CBS domain-containing protein
MLIGRKGVQMSVSWKIGRLAGINVYVHWTFSLLVAWILLSYLLGGQGIGTALLGVLLICGLFACVVLHELGHALMARRFGVGTSDITLLPIGGLARLERMPEEPRQELLIAIAGPLVNIAIAVVLAGTLIVMGSHVHPATTLVVGGSLLAQLMWANLSLAAFNFLPAFPMDGGRMLRALLALRLPYERATQVAATVGRTFAIMFGIVGVLAGNWILVLIAVFVFLAAGQESAMVHFRALAKGASVHSAMSRSFRCLDSGQLVSEALRYMNEGYHGDFPVISEGRLVGMLFQRDVMEAIRHGRIDSFIAELAHHGCPILQANDQLADAIMKMRQCGCPSAVVVDGASIVGLLSHETIDEWLTVHRALFDWDSITMQEPSEAAKV